MNKGIETSTAELHREAKLLRLKHRREQHLLMYDQAQIPALLKVRSKNGVRTRSSNKKIMKLKKPRKERFKKCLAYKGPKTWNNLPESMHHIQTKGSSKLLVRRLIDSESKESIREGERGTGVKVFMDTVDSEIFLL